MASAPEIAKQAQAALGKLERRTKLAAAGIVGAAALVFATLIFSASAPESVLYAGLDPKDAAAMVTALDAAKIVNASDAGGTAIRVRPADVDRARMLLASQDLPRSGTIGLEMFEKQELGLTEFAQQVNYRRAMQGELERTITTLAPIAAARVHLTLPKRRVFADERVDATASVTVKLRNGRQLEAGQVAAIANLVAGSVEGLSPERVTIVDSRGAMLSRPEDQSSAGAHLDHAREYSRDLELRVTRMLERTIGTGGAEVRVTADFDYSRTTTTQEQFDPEGQVVLKEQTQQSVDRTAASGAAAARVGADANAAGIPSQADGSTNQRNSVSKDYAVSKTVTQRQGQAATLRRLSVAVLVDGDWTTPEDGGAPTFAPKPEAELARLRSVVENAVGFDATRGDKVELVSVPLRGDEEQFEPETPLPEVVKSWLPISVIPMAGIALIILALKLKPRRTPAIEAELIPAGVTVDAAQTALASGRPEALAALRSAPALPEVDLEDRARVREEVLRLAAEDPARAADILKSWMRESA